MYTSRIAWETLRKIESSTITGSYQALGIPLIYPSYICKLVNNTNQLVTISIDGSTDIDIAPAGSFWLYDESRMASTQGVLPALPAGTQFYVKGTAGDAGTYVYLVSQYIVQI